MKRKPFFYAVLAGILSALVVFLLNGFVFEWSSSIGIFLGIALNQYYGQRILSENNIGCAHSLEEVMITMAPIVGFPFKRSLSNVSAYLCSQNSLESLA